MKKKGNTREKSVYIYVKVQKAKIYCDITEPKLFVERIYTINHVCVSRARGKYRTRKCPNTIDGVLSWRVFTETLFMWLEYCVESMNDLMNKSLYGKVYISDGVFKYPFSSCTLKDIDEEELVC